MPTLPCPAQPTAPTLLSVQTSSDRTLASSQPQLQVRIDETRHLVTSFWGQIGPYLA